MVQPGGGRFDTGPVGEDLLASRAAQPVLAADEQHILCHLFLRPNTGVDPRREAASG